MARVGVSVDVNRRIEDENRIKYGGTCGVPSNNGWTADQKNAVCRSRVVDKMNVLGLVDIGKDEQQATMNN